MLLQKFNIVFLGKWCWRKGGVYGIELYLLVMGRTGVTYVMVEVQVLFGGRISTGFVRVLENESGVGWLIILGARWVIGLILFFWKDSWVE